MVTEFWARLEDAHGRVVGPDPAWTPQRQFLWDVVHDTRGLLRGEATAQDLELIRRIDDPQGPLPREHALDPREVRRIYETILRRAGEHDARFRLVAPSGTDAWAAVQSFEEGDAEYALVGGWTGPVLRVIQPEPDVRPIDDRDEVQVGRRRFRVRAVPYRDYFARDFDGLVELLKHAEAEGLRVRFLQR